MTYFWGILFISLHAMVPITLTAVGEVVGETGGLFNIGLEGILLLSAFTGALGAESAGPTVGLLVGMGTGALVGLLFSVINTYWKGTQMITGIGINLFAMGFVAFGLIVLGAPGFHAVPAESRLAAIHTPVGTLSPIIFVALVIPFLVHWFLNRTRAGLVSPRIQGQLNPAPRHHVRGSPGRTRWSVHQRLLDRIGDQGDLCRPRVHRARYRRVQRIESAFGPARWVHLRVLREPRHLDSEPRWVEGDPVAVRGDDPVRGDAPRRRRGDRAGSVPQGARRAV